MENKITSEDPFHFTPLWNAILDIYQEFAAICEKHGLRHYVIGGTLLGAVRHKGFIPWDDDFDLAMPRQDYEKFKELAKAELPQHLRWMDRRNTPEFKLLFGKLMDCRQEKVVELERAVGHQLSNGLFIDIFPIDGYPEGMVSRAWIKLSEFMIKVVERHYTYRRELWPLTLKRRAVDLVGLLLSPLFRKIKTDLGYLDECDRHIMRFPFDVGRSSGTGGCLTGRFQMVFPPRMFAREEKLKFEGIEVSAPAMWRGFLEINYGDYMTLPPAEKRRPTHDYGTHCPWWLGPTSISK